MSISESIAPASATCNIDDGAASWWRDMMTKLGPEIVTADRRQSRHRSPRRHFRDGERAAVIRAMTAAKLYLDQTVPTMAAAATACGSNAHYVRAAAILMEAENLTLVSRVAKGHVSLLQAARDVRQLAGLVKAYRTATAADHVAFAHVIRPATLFDTAVAPAI